MSLFNRRTLLFLSAAALGGCGFTPVYAPGGTGAALRGRVLVDAPEALDSYLLVQTLEDRLGRSSQPLYRLSVNLVLGEQGQALTQAGDITRYSVVGLADYTLRVAGSGDVIASGRVENFTGYSATGSTAETLASERDARARLMTILADQITTELYATAELPG